MSRSQPLTKICPDRMLIATLPPRPSFTLTGSIFSCSSIGARGAGVVGEVFSVFGGGDTGLGGLGVCPAGGAEVGVCPNAAVTPEPRIINMRTDSDLLNIDLIVGGHFSKHIDLLRVCC